MYDGIPVVYYGQEQYFKGKDDPANREPLWPSKYLSNNATRFIASLNQFRNFLVASADTSDNSSSPTSDWLHQSTQVLSHTEHDIVLARGPVISILTGRGSAVSANIHSIILLTEFSRNSMQVLRYSTLGILADNP
jgi:alpha-amylase